MKKQFKSPILKTLCYSDIFNYPLTKEEIWRFLIGKKISKISFEKELRSLLKSEVTPLRQRHSFYFLSGRGKIVQRRLERQKESKRKINLAKKIIRCFNFIPTVKFVGISGALSLENSDKNDDIDLFVITSKRRLWWTRLTMIIFLKFMGRYRSFNASNVSDKICLNMLIDEEVLTMPKEKQNLYTAHEVVQLLPILDKENTYLQFLNANRWIHKFLPNVTARIKNPIRQAQGRQESRIKKKNPLFIIHNSLFILEWLAKYIQLLSINKHRTTEIISDKFLAFHPFPYKRKILGEYNKRFKEYGI